MEVPMLRVPGDVRGVVGDCSLRTLAPRIYRLIDALLQPHPQLGGLSDAMKEALRDAITWLKGQGPEAATARSLKHQPHGSGRDRLMFALVLLVLSAPGGFRQIAQAFRILAGPVPGSCATWVWRPGGW